MRFTARSILICCILGGCAGLSRSVDEQPAAPSLGFQLDENGTYRYRQAFAVEGDAAELFDRALRWVEQSHRSVGEGVTAIDRRRRRIHARGAFRDRASDVSEYIYYNLHVETRDGWYGVTYDSLVYQPAPTHHVIEFELRLPRRWTIYETTAEYISNALTDLSTSMPASTPVRIIPVDAVRFKLSSTQNGFALSDGGKAVAQIPPAWLVSQDDVEEEAIVSPDLFSEEASAFPIREGITGIHLSSYDIQSEGSAQAAAGRDAFLIYDEEDGVLSDGQMMLGVTKLRVRSMGCWQALMHRFMLADVNGDDMTDVGVVREEVNCVGMDELTPLARGYPVKWHVFTGFDWEYRPEYDDALPAGARPLSLIGLEKSPIEFVREIEDRR